MNIFVGGLPYAVSDDELRDAFEAHGTVTSAKVITDRETGRSRGFGFVEMSDDGEANAAIEAMNGSEMGGRTLTVNQARPREERGGGGGYNRGGGGNRGGGNRGGGNRGGGNRGSGGNRGGYGNRDDYNSRY